MSDEYQQTHLEIDGVTDAERLWIEPFMDESWWLENSDDGFRGFDMRHDLHGQLVITADHINVDNLAWFLRQFLAANRPRDHIIFDYCWHGDDYYGGAAALVTAKKIVHFNPRDMAGQWRQTGTCAPDVHDHGDAIDHLKEAVDEGLPEDDGQGR